ncbi:UNVERIFIED_ORG: hypothetical protein ABIB13_003218 [Arthrobacter sp. UYEF2]
MTTSTAVPTTAPSKFSTGKKLLASAAIVGAIASVAALGSFGSFGGSTSASQKVSTGSVGLEMPYSTFNGPIAGMLPGDTVERVATLNNPGSASLKEIVLTTTRTEPSALNLDPVNGLRLHLQTCSTPWTAVPGGPDVCGGSMQTVLNSPLAAMSTQVLAGLQSVNPSGQDYLLATFTLPSSADATFQNLSADATFEFDGIQRDAKFLDS